MIEAFKRPELAPILEELASRFAEGGPPPVTITLRNLPLDAQRALADLLGAERLPGPNTRLRLDRLAASLGIETADLRSAVEQMRGPLGDRRALRRAAESDREALWSWLAKEVGSVAFLSGAEATPTWLAHTRAAGVPGGDVPTHRLRLARALAVLRCLPAQGIPLAALADDVLDDPHALDRGHSVSALVLDAISAVRGHVRPKSAEEVRTTWEEVGVACDPLSSSVLVLGLRPPGQGPLDSWLQETAEAGEPAAVTLSQLRRWPLTPLAPGDVAYVVENPSLLSDAASRQWEGPPIVCSSGRPTIAVVTLLRQLASNGGMLAQHADFDASGVAITSWLAENSGTRPWLMGSDDYLSAVERSGSQTPLTMPLPDTPWDPRLTIVMTEHGMAVYEETVRLELLSAMAGSVRPLTTAAEDRPTGRSSRDRSAPR